MKRRVVIIVGPDGVDGTYTNDQDIELFMVDASLTESYLDEDGEARLMNQGQAFPLGSYAQFQQHVADGEWDPSVVPLVDQLLGPRARP